MMRLFAGLLRSAYKELKLSTGLLRGYVRNDGRKAEAIHPPSVIARNLLPVIAKNEVTKQSRLNNRLYIFVLSFKFRLQAE